MKIIKESLISFLLVMVIVVGLFCISQQIEEKKEEADLIAFGATIDGRLLLCEYWNKNADGLLRYLKTNPYLFANARKNQCIELKWLTKLIKIRAAQNKTLLNELRELYKNFKENKELISDKKYWVIENSKDIKISYYLIILDLERLLNQRTPSLPSFKKKNMRMMI